MAETEVKTQTCKTCDADIRKSALFCYNCGNSVAPDVVVVKTSKIDGGDQILKKESVTENGNGTTPIILKDKAEIINDSAKPEIQPEKNLKSAASLRKKTKSIQTKKVEIFWSLH